MCSHPPCATQPTPLPAPAAVTLAVPCHEARQLTQGGTVANIALNGQLYALRITRAGKLILTK